MTAVTYKQPMIKEALATFLDAKTPPTRRAYSAAIARLLEYISKTNGPGGGEKSIDNLSAADALGFFGWLKCQKAPDGNTLADATVMQRIHLLRKLFRYLVAIEAVERNVFDAIISEIPKRQRRQKRPTKLIPIEKIKEMLDLPDQRTKEGRRDYCLLSILFGGGLRRSEAHHLNVDDVVISAKGTLSLVLRYAKAGCNQTQSLPTWAAEAFTSLVSQRVGEGATSGDPLFVFYLVSGRARERITVETIRRIYMRYTERVGLGKVSPHSARASAATYLLQEGCSEISVADFLRHANEDQVRIYDKRSRGAETNPGLKINYNRTKGENSD